MANKIDTLSIATSHVEVCEDRPLSPILSRSKTIRDMASNRRKINKHKARINLSKKFQSKSDASLLDSQENFPTSSFVEALCAAERIKKIESIERERREYYEILASPTTVIKQNKNVLFMDDPNFKKPLSPASRIRSHKHKENNSPRSLQKQDSSKVQSKIATSVTQTSYSSSFEVENEISDSQMILAATVAETSDRKIKFEGNSSGDISDSELSEAEVISTNKIKINNKQRGVKGFSDCIDNDNGLKKFEYLKSLKQATQKIEIIESKIKETFCQELDVHGFNEYHKSDNQNVNSTDIFGGGDCEMNVQHKNCNNDINKNQIHKKGKKRYNDEEGVAVQENIGSEIIRMTCKKTKYANDSKSPKKASCENRIQIDLSTGTSINITYSSDEKLSIINKGKQKKDTSLSLEVPAPIIGEIDHMGGDVKREKNKSPLKENISRDFCGFKTAAGKPVKPSEKFLKNAEKLFKDIECSSLPTKDLNKKIKTGKKAAEFANKPEISSELKKTIYVDSATCTDKIVIQEHLNKISTSSHRTEDNKKDVDVQAGPGKLAKISGKAFDRARIMIHDIKDCIDHYISDSVKKDNSCRLSVKSANSTSSSENIRVIQTPKRSVTTKNGIAGQTLKYNSNLNHSQGVTDKALHKAKNTFSEVEEKNQSTINDVSIGTSSKLKAVESGISDDVLDKALTYYDQIRDFHCTKSETKNKDLLEDALQFFDNVNTNSNMGFRTASNNPILIPPDKLLKAKALLEVGSKENSINVLDTSVKEIEKTRKNCKTELKTSVITSIQSKSLNSNMNANIDKSLNKPSTSFNVSKTPCVKKRLGMSACKKIVIPEHKLEAAKLLLECNLNSKDNQNTNNTPVKGNRNLYSSTPLRNQQLETINEVNSRSFEKSLVDTTLTPIKADVKEPVECKVVLEEKSDSKVLLRPVTSKDIKEIQSQMDREYRKLKKKMDVVANRWKLLSQQLQKLENVNGTDQRPRAGWLFERKQNTENRQKFSDLNMNFRPNSCTENINPQNAINIHFNYNSSELEETIAIETKDGASVVISLDNMAGLNEVQNAFYCMPGVDTRLIPKGWVENHYKWIVWKLASYDNKYTEFYEECLTVDNVMSQLKYRYDREIDRAQRSALRKILELDDVPQKRMILCVSNIFEANGRYEIELTDKWYAIRTIVDLPLCVKIRNNKIKIGTKMFVQCAELLNCEGCHPLEVPADVRLKINYNNTRKASWDSKLGYQKIPIPFIIPLSSVHPDGGSIGCLILYIARVYPVQYLEQQGLMRVWRNLKAEEARIAEYEQLLHKNLETIQHNIESELDSPKKAKKRPHNTSYEELSKIKCPKTLHEILENSNDPDSLMESLSSSQKTKIMDYHQNNSSLKLENKMNNMKVEQRKVTPVLKLLVIDTKGQSTYLTIWNPTEYHFQMLKEDTTFLFYNIIPKKTGDISTTYKTYYSQSNAIIHNKNLHTRQILPIAMTFDPFIKLTFNEYDTVGLVVQKRVSDCDQDLWVSDYVGRLLHIKIWCGPLKCSLLDGLNKGHLVAMANLVHNKSIDKFGQAIANTYSVISRYPQHKHLQEALATFKTQLPEDTTSLLNDCDKNIEGFEKALEHKTTY